MKKTSRELHGHLEFWDICLEACENLEIILADLEIVEMICPDADLSSAAAHLRLCGLCTGIFVWIVTLQMPDVTKIALDIK